MPISSGGEGHIGIGVDKSIKWIPDGGGDYSDFKRNNSYLQRYLYGGGTDESGGKGKTFQNSKQSQARNVHVNPEEVSHKKMVSSDRQQEKKESPNNHPERTIIQLKSPDYHKDSAVAVKDVKPNTNKNEFTTTGHPKQTIDSKAAIKKRSSACALL